MAMRLRLVFSVVLISLIGVLAFAAQGQTSHKKKKKTTSSHQAAEKILRADPDPRTRQTPDGDHDRDRSRTGQNRKGYMPRYMPAPGDDDQTVETRRPVESKLIRAGTFNGDLRTVKFAKPVKRERPELEEPVTIPRMYGQPTIDQDETRNPLTKPGELDNSSAPVVGAPAPAPNATFDGLDFNTFGAGHPPDTNGDVGPNNYIQTINTSIGMYDKASGTRQVGITFNSFMSQGHFGNLCDTDNFGDPVVLYDSFEDRWVITDFAFTIDGSGNITSNSFQCFAVSKTGDPVAGGWNFYYTVQTDYLGDYPKFGIWPDGIYWAANMFQKAAGGAFVNPRVTVMNKAQMYAGAPTVQVVTFDAPSSEFTMLPSNARIQTGAPPAGSPNYFATVGSFLNAESVYKFHVDWNRISLSTLTGPFTSISATSWTQFTGTSVPTPANGLDTLYPRTMVQNEYSNIGGTESLWFSHTVGATTSASHTGVRYYQLKVTGGNVETSTSQAFTYSPDATIFRWMPSVDINRNGDMAMGYSTANSTTNPGIKYAGRLAGDPANSITLTEQLMFQGTGTQSGSCGGTCTRWGDYSAMTLDPDGCTFWYQNMYYAANNLDWLTRIGNFKYAGCSAFLNNGSLSGTVTSSVTGLPINGATVLLGNRTATTNVSGTYSFTNLPAGTYSTETAAATGYNTGNAATLAVTDAVNTTQNFSLDTASGGGCNTDTAQADFQLGVPTNTDLTASAGNVELANSTAVDQQNNSVGANGFGFSNTTWVAQTFTPSVTGKAMTVDLNLFCFSCTGTPPNLVVSIRNATGNFPSGADLASGSVPFTTSGAGGLYSVTLTTPPTLTAGTQYAIVARMASTYATGTPAYLISTTDAYAGGRAANSTNSGGTWSTTAGGTVTNTDLGFQVYMNTGFATSGNLVSGIKDSNPVVAGTTQWGTIGWTVTTPTNTGVKFQAAASNSPYGPFNFVGPDNTSATFFTNGGSLAQFNGLRYLKYEALLTTTDTTATPLVDDVTICYTSPRVWTGAVSTDWNNAANWSSGGVPGTSDAAIIPTAGVTNNPTNTTSVSVASLQLGSGRIVNTGANTLTVNGCTTNAVTGGDATSYVNGTLIRCVLNAQGPYLFPMGTASGYGPVSLNNVVTTGSFSVTSHQGAMSPLLATTSPARYWTLTPVSGVTGADISLTYLDSDLPPGANESSFQIIRDTGSGLQTFAPTTSNTTTDTFTLNGVTTFSNWAVGVLAPTAAGVQVSGQVLSAAGSPIGNATVFLTAMDGTVRTTISSPFGYYSFDDVASGQSYTLNASAKRFRFTPRVVNVSDTISGFNLTADN